MPSAPADDDLGNTSSLVMPSDVGLDISIKVEPPVDEVEAMEALIASDVDLKSLALLGNILDSDALAAGISASDAGISGNDLGNTGSCAGNSGNYTGKFESVAALSQDMNTIAHDLEISSIRRGRGRPRSSGLMVSAIRHGRGRPRNSDLLISAIRRGRGRPRSSGKVGFAKRGTGSFVGQASGNAVWGVSLTSKRVVREKRPWSPGDNQGEPSTARRRMEVTRVSEIFLGVLALVNIYKIGSFQKQQFYSFKSNDFSTG